MNKEYQVCKRCIMDTSDPEIYFNNIAVERLGVGIVDRGLTNADILSKVDELSRNIIDLRKNILKRWGALDGNRYAAKIFADNFLGGH